MIEACATQPSDFLTELCQFMHTGHPNAESIAQFFNHQWLNSIMYNGTDHKSNHRMR